MTLGSYGKGKCIWVKESMISPSMQVGLRPSITQLGNVNMHNRIQRLQKLKTCHLRSQTYINSRVTYRINSFPHRTKCSVSTLPTCLCLTSNKSSCSQLSLEPHIHNSHHHISHSLNCNRASPCFLPVTSVCVFGETCIHLKDKKISVLLLCR